MPGSPNLCSVKLFKRFTLLLVAALFVAPGLRAQREKLSPEDLDYVEEHFPEAKKTMTGIRYIVLQKGQGEMPKPGNKVSVLYVLKLLRGQLVDRHDSNREDPFIFRVRRDQVIEGWDQILQVMRVGEKRMVIIPSQLGYGTLGQPPHIPRNATLLFEIELLEIFED
jgi:FKBP-type peptidyl-prolyl cis-trans isomerase